MRLWLSVQLACASLLCTLLITRVTYLREARLFALTPMIEAALRVPPVTDLPMLVLALILCAAGLRWPGRAAPHAVLLAIILYWLLQDWNRVHPYLMMYAATLLTGALQRRLGTEVALDLLRWMVAGVYFWAGFHKLNLTFITQVFPWFVQPFIHPDRLNDFGAGIFVILSVLTPYFEMLIGLFLLIPKYRPLATMMAAIMLVMVLLCLGPLGHNYNASVWPWNLFLFGLEFLLFFGHPNRLSFPTERGKSALWGSIACFCILPVLALDARWDSYAGFKLYSGNISSATFVLTPEDAARLPARLHPYLEGHTLALSRWSIGEMQTAVSPEEKVFIGGVQNLCPLLIHPDQAYLHILRPAPFNRLDRPVQDRFPCLR